MRGTALIGPPHSVASLRRLIRLGIGLPARIAVIALAVACTGNVTNPANSGATNESRILATEPEVTRPVGTASDGEEEAVLPRVALRQRPLHEIGEPSPARAMRVMHPLTALSAAFPWPDPNIVIEPPDAPAAPQAPRAAGRNCAYELAYDPDLKRFRMSLLYCGDDIVH